MDDDTNTMQSTDGESDGSYGDDGLDYGASGGDGGSAGDDGSSGDTGTQDDESYGSADDSAGGGDWGSFDPASAAASVKTGLGDTLSSAWHAAGHLAHAGYDFGASTVHAVEAAGDAFVGDYDATKHRMEQAGYDSEDMRNQLHQAGQDLWGN
jgi:hypothetical protein